MNSVSSVVETSPPRTTNAMGCTISRPAICPTIANGANRAAAVMTELITGSTPHERVPESLTLLPLEMLCVPDLHDGLTGGDPEDREGPRDGPDRNDPSIDQHRDRSPGEAQGQHQKDQRREAPIADRRLHQQEHAERRGDREAERLPIGGAAGRIVPDHDRVILHRELQLSQPSPHVIGDGAQAATGRPGGDVDAPRNVDVPYDRWSGADPHVRHIAQRDLFAPRGVDREVLDAGEVVADLRRSPHNDVEHLLIVEEAADLHARQEGGRRPAHVARHDTVARRLIEVDLDLERRLLGLGGDARALDPVDPGENLPHLVGLAAKDPEVLPEDPHGNGFVRSAEDLIDPRGWVGHHVAIESRVSMHHLVDR
jgi:hypothetical protein